MRYLLLVTAGLLLSFQSYSQRVSDLGIRFSSAEFNRIIIEYRKPVGDNFRFRLGASMGFVYEYPVESIFDADDSLVIIRKKETFGNHYNLRVGFERKLTYDWLSVHADLIFGYSSITNRNRNYFYSPDSTGAWLFYDKNPFTLQDELTATSINSVLGGGVCAGLSFNFPVTESFILNFSGDYTAMMHFAVAQKETDDVYNEFELPTGSVINVFASASIGLRFVFNSATSAPVAPVE